MSWTRPGGEGAIDTRWLRTLRLAWPVSGALLIGPTTASASSGSHSYLLEFGDANVVPGITNFNHTVHGDNIFIQTS